MTSSRRAKNKKRTQGRRQRIKAYRRVERPTVTQQMRAVDVFRWRALAGMGIMLLLFVALGGRYAWLQIDQHEAMSAKAKDNRVRTLPIVPARGLIVDRNGVLLADNVPAFRLDVLPERVDDLDAALEALRHEVSLVNVDLAAFKKRIKAQKSFRSVTLRDQLTELEVARFSVQQHRFSGFEVVPYLQRRYLHGEVMGHIVGYTGRLDERDLKRVDPEEYEGTKYIGKNGVERSYETRLHGRVGHERIEINSEGRRLALIDQTKAVPGQELTLTIDLALQQSAFEAFGDQEGAAVAVDPRNGEVLAMVSKPSYDPNLFVGGISHRDYRRLMDSPSQPMFNRITDGAYEPGSTMKPFVGLAGLALGARTSNERYFSTGSYRLPTGGRDYRDWRGGGHGSVDLKEALAQSVNTYFYSLSVELGIDTLSPYLGQFGFGRKTGIDLPHEASGVLPSRSWKRKRFNKDWYPGETVITGIGQGYWVTTPLQLVQGMATIANRGVRPQLHVVKAVREVGQEQSQDLPWPPHDTVAMDPQHVQAVVDGMVAVMHGATGTARRAAAGAEYIMAGKTGTAQRVSRKGNVARDPKTLPMHLRNRALFVAFAPAHDPRIAVAVVVEEGESGSRAAAPVARKIIDAWFAIQPPPKPSDFGQAQAHNGATP